MVDECEVKLSQECYDFRICSDRVERVIPLVAYAKKANCPLDEKKLVLDAILRQYAARIGCKYVFSVEYFLYDGKDQKAVSTAMGLAYRVLDTAEPSESRKREGLPESLVR